MMEILRQFIKGIQLGASFWLGFIAIMLVFNNHIEPHTRSKKKTTAIKHETEILEQSNYSGIDVKVNQVDMPEGSIIVSRTIRSTFNQPLDHV